MKKGSNALVIISGVIPAPQSATVSWWYAPANGAIETRMLPPSGSASRALRIELHDSVDDQLRVKTHKRWRSTERRLHDDVARQHPLQDHHSRLAPHRRLHGPRFGLISPAPRCSQARPRRALARQWHVRDLASRTESRFIVPCLAVTAAGFQSRRGAHARVVAIGRRRGIERGAPVLNARAAIEPRPRAAHFCFIMFQNCGGSLEAAGWTPTASAPWAS